ncbi:HNH endonuclease [Deinococcus sp. RIT780]|uniref:HNH endonuclease n=1 Tax=Deinococcus sp. RIT780 TaxID=2870472 RepID=UPI001C8A9832|nr:HNH endonuclease [Deinococcus sp. RIT780]MBX8463685.1 HNH endonuclease [Deinococcus sp. RIT780]
MNRPMNRKQRREQDRRTTKMVGRRTFSKLVDITYLNGMEGQALRTAMRLELKEDAGSMRCFICGHSESEGREMTREHIIPKWILGMHQLYDEKLEILNASLIPYKNLTTPTCSPCNGALSKVENRLRRAFEARDVTWLRSPEGEDDLIVLASKIYLGLRAKQAHLRDHVNRRPSILTGSRHEGTSDPYIFYLLQTARFRTTVHANRTRLGHLPASAVAFRSKLEGFMIADTNLGDLFLRVNGISVLASLRDGGDARQRLEANNAHLMTQTLGEPSEPDRHDIDEVEELILWNQMGYLSTCRIDDGFRIHNFQHHLGHLDMHIGTEANYLPLDRDAEREFLTKRLLERGIRLEFTEGALPSKVWV